MCGIFFTLINGESDGLIDKIDFELLKKRGPDSFEILNQRVEEKNLLLCFAASVLSLRGGNMAQVTVQPLKCKKTGNVLLWNGEIFSSDLVPVNLDENDGANLLEKLSENLDETHLFKIIESIKGPYAFIYYEKKSNNIYFARDRLGRRSLLISCGNASDKAKPFLTLTSVQVDFNNSKNEFQEVKANGLYKLNLNDLSNLSLYEWTRKSEEIKTNNAQSYIKNINLILSEIKLIDSISCFNEQIEGDFEANNDNIEDLVNQFYEKLKESVSKRVRNVPNYCKQCSHLLPKAIKFDSDNSNEIHCEHAKVAILFSGGVDSTVLAALADECIPKNVPIDLLNIAFEKQKTNSNASSKKSKDEEEELENEISREYEDDGFLVPDRISGLESLKELNPNRKWNFVEINVTLDELRKEREQVIKHLLYPHQTVLDDSIGCALWFASRGFGTIKQNSIKTIYKSNTEVLLLGMGADEQLAGYARHRTRYEKDGIKSLCNELKMEMARISERNLGRDDRILSDHGKESRLPYLDEDVISFLNELNVKQKCNMKLEKGLGEKYLLRCLAVQKFGLKFSSRLKKRAIQFGSRVAKIENIKEKASDVCDRIAVDLKITNKE